MKKIVLSSIILIGAIGLGTLATIAFFQDSERSSGNTLGAGIINLHIGNTSYYHGDASSATTWQMNGELTIEKFLYFTGLNPGDWGEDTVSIDVGSNNAYACAHLAITSNIDNGINDAEDEVDGAVKNGGDGTAAGDLAGDLEFLLWVDDGDNVLETGETQLAQGLASTILAGVTYPLADSTVNYFGTGPGGLSGDATYYIGKAWCYGDLGVAPLAQDGHGDQRTPAGAITNTGITCNGAPVTNISQTDRLEGDISFYAEQVSNNNTFVCSDALFASQAPAKVLGALENKNTSGGWEVIVDGTAGTLQYDPVAPTFNYDFSATGLVTGTEYCLIYYKDPWPGTVRPNTLI